LPWPTPRCFDTLESTPFAAQGTGEEGRAERGAGLRFVRESDSGGRKILGLFVLVERRLSFAWRRGVLFLRPWGNASEGMQGQRRSIGSSSCGPVGSSRRENFKVGGLAAKDSWSSSFLCPCRCRLRRRHGHGPTGNGDPERTWLSPVQSACPGKSGRTKRGLP
jgi:hypothetical protein